MSMFNNSFTRFLTSGFGTGTAAGKAVGITVFVLLIGVFVIVGLIKLIYNMISSSKRDGAPDLKEGDCCVRLDNVGPTPHLVFDQLCQFNAISPALAKKLMDKAPIGIFYGCSLQTAEDIVTVLESKGAMVSILTK